MPFTSVSRKILCLDLLPLFPLPCSEASPTIPMSISYYEVLALQYTSCNFSSSQQLKIRCELNSLFKALVLFLTHFFPLKTVQDASQAISHQQTCQRRFKDYIAFQIQDDSFTDIANCIAIIRGFTHHLSSINMGYTSLESVLLCVPEGYHSVDLSLYKVQIYI